MLLRTAALSMLLALELNSFAQERYIRKTFTTDDGLAYNNVQGICQDKEGFYWIATWDGLSRFDGYEFRNFYHIPEDTASFPFFSLDKVLVDCMNNVWVFSEGQPAVVYNRIKENFKKVYFGRDKLSLLSDIINGPDSCLWISTSTGLARYNVRNGNSEVYMISYIDYKNDPLDHNSPVLAFDNLNRLWICYIKAGRLLFFEEAGRNGREIAFRYHGAISPEFAKQPGLRNSNLLFDVYTGPSGKTYFFSKYGLFYLKNSSSQVSEYAGLPDPADFTGCKPYYIWAEDRTGIHFIDVKRKKTGDFKPTGNCMLEAAFFDRFGNLWTGEINSTHENTGLNRYTRMPGFFSNYLTGESANGTFNLVFPIVKDRENALWVGTRSLDYICNITPDGMLKKFFFDRFSAHPDQSRARCIVYDTTGLWIGTSNDLLIRYEFQTRKLKLVYPTAGNKDEKPALSFHNILKSGKKLIINGRDGVFSFDTETGQARLGYRYNNAGTGFTLVPDGADGYWVGSWANALIHLDKDFQQTSYTRLGTEGNIVEHICPGDRNDLWVALQGGGLGHYEINSGKYEVFSSASGLSNNVLYSILRDRQGKLWISTDDGIALFDPSTRKFRNFGASDGLLVREFNSDSYFQSADGEMFFGGVGGMVGFYPDSIYATTIEKAEPHIIVTDLKVSGKSRISGRPVYLSDTIWLSRGDNNFQITLACLNLKNPERVRFRYRLTGRETNWIETDARNRTVSFANLSPSNYILETEAKADESQWLARRQIIVCVPRRFFELTLVRIIIFLIILSGVAGVIFLYIQNLKFKARQAHDELRLNSLRGQMNPHFIFNSLNSINYFIAIEDKKAANQYMADFSRLIRTILMNMSSDYIPLAEEIDSISDYLKLEHMRFSDKFEYTLETSGIADTEEVEVTPGLVQPFIENAVWHGIRPLEDRKGYIRISFHAEGKDKVTCTVEDDGVGRKMAASFNNKLPGHKSRGIQIVRERLAIINRSLKTDYDIRIDDLFPGKADTGTRVIVEIPARQL